MQNLYSRSIPTGDAFTPSHSWFVFPRTNKTRPQHKQSARDSLSAPSAKGGSHGDQQNGIVATLVCWACSEVACPCDGLPERLLPNMEVPELTWNPLSSSIAQCFFWAGPLEREHDQAKETQGRSARTFHSGVWFSFSKLRNLLAASSYHRAWPELSRHGVPSKPTGAANIIACISQRWWWLPRCRRTPSVQPWQHCWHLRVWKGGKLGMCSNSSKPLQMLRGKFSRPHSLSS